MKYFNEWVEALTKPAQTFKKEKGDLADGAKHIILGGIIAGIITSIGTFFGVFGYGLDLLTTFFGAGITLFVAILTLIFVPILSVIAWLVFSAILYIIAVIFGFKGNFERQSFLIALYSAPLAIMNSLINLVPVISFTLAFLAFAYSLYLLYLVFIEVYKKGA